MKVIYWSRFCGNFECMKVFIMIIVNGRSFIIVGKVIFVKF